MRNFAIKKTPLDGLIIIEGSSYKLDGFSNQTYNRVELRKLGFDVDFVQENQSMSKKGVLRGVHLQKNYPQGKLVRVASGTIFDVAVDLRADSKTFKKWFGLELSSENLKQLYIPEGFAHGFLSLEENTIVSFKVTDYFHPGDEIGFKWNDLDIGILWPIMRHNMNNDENFRCTMYDGTPLILGYKDQKLPCASEVFRK